MKLQVHTIRYGSPDYLAHCAPTLDAWVSRYGLELVVWDDTPRGYPCVKFCEIDMLQAFLASDADEFLYVDADVYVHPDAPLPDLSMSGLHAHTDSHHAVHFFHWKDWCAEHCGLEVMPGAGYYNAGVWACDRAAAELILAAVIPPHVEFFQDQHAWNAWVERARQQGLAIRLLPVVWNRWGRDHGPAWFFHFWENEKLKDLAALKTAGYLP